MINVTLKEYHVRALPFYLAMEEYVARNIDKFSDDVFFLWQVAPTVIFGRNQVISNEVNVEYCKKIGIKYYRRKSGGGCVYADEGNYMFSYITKDHNVSTTFEAYTSKVVSLLQSLGISDAHASSRNDIMIGERKVSGNAFYHSNGCSIVHGTMLYDTDMQNMLNAITPSTEKLTSKGVDSVRQHITTLKEHIALSKEEFADAAVAHLCDESVEFGAADEAKISEIAEQYFQPEFIMGKNPRCSLHKTVRVEGVGEFVVDAEIRNNCIVAVNLLGDYFLLGDVDKISHALEGVNYDKDSVTDALKEIKLEEIIYKLNIKQFLNILF